jgi:peptidoglycan/xylan/chitin deacetylase (PgdA/CDA1 family)/putative cell wall-binding protein
MLTTGVLLLLAPLLFGSVSAALPPVPAAITNPVVDPVPTVPNGPDLGRIGGADRYDMSANISRYRFAAGEAESVYLTRGDLFFDAMVGGVLEDGPVLLLPSCRGVPASVAAEIARLDPERVVALGGEASVCDATLATAADGRPTDRLGGADRFETAARIAHEAYPEGSSRVYLAVGDTVPDAVVAGTLTDGPVLLTAPDRKSVPDATRRAIVDLDATEVVALGGAAAVPEHVLSEAAQGRRTDRISGADRYATSVAIAQHAHRGAHQRIFLARGDGTNFPDAVAAGVLIDGPVLLTRGTCHWVSDAVLDHAASESPSEVIALGGSAALCDTTLRQVASAVSPRVAPDCDAVTCVALTFDDGPKEHTERLLDLLAQEQVPVTFFQAGSNVDNRPATARRAAMEGHQVANHTYSHPDLRTLTLAQQQSEVDRMAAAARRAGVAKPAAMRPPFGYFNNDTRRLGLSVIKWNVNPKDWAGGSSAEIRDFVLTNVQPGAIVLQHDTVGNTVDAMPEIIDGLRARGYHFVTTDELLGPLNPGDLAYSQHDIRRWTGSSTQALPTEDGVVDLAPYSADD